MSGKVHIIIYRLSAMGDVAMLVHAVRNVLDNNPNASITVVTRKPYDLFFGEHERLNFLFPDLKGKHKGLTGLMKLSKELIQLKPDIFVDEHDVLRSKIIRSRLKLSGIKTIVFNKGRKEKLAMLTRKTAFSQLDHSITRYTNALSHAGLKTEINYHFKLPIENNDLIRKSKKYRIGIAPFSAHDSKEWGLSNIIALLSALETDGNFEILLFGGGVKEVDQLDTLSEQFTHAESVAGKHTLKEELRLMRTCDIFLAMDSSNMHLADLVGCKVISIWISTHPYFGFYAWNNLHNCIALDQQNEKSIPISIFGKIGSEEDKKNTEKIRKMIKPDQVFKRIKEMLD
ncbi:MAG: glycosyltransferase family 9 protein [Flavobacteriales bacterium]|nr:glycosyltransferase family 9 protein [Flavobacteriales bacterium]